MHIITLTSDWKENDFYVASLKGKLLSACPEAQIIDINHRIKSFNSSHAAYIVRNAYPHFPENTIHIIAVNTEPENGVELLAARKDKHYFLCADNGILGLLGGTEPDEVITLTEHCKEEPDTFIALSVFARIACELSKGTALRKLGSPAKDYNRQIPLRATIEDLSITGSVIHIDSYQNAITNISQELFKRVGNGNAFEIYVQSKYNMINRINKQYNETDPGDLLAIFNSSGLMEIAIRNGNAAGLLNLDTNSTIRVEFKEG
ncbi:MAG: SAM-dependent chlorinase/fluorinase [Bacteroidetes bacterium]|nr:SAM-dependent chlorinase/fluorinase [Bacteroidota bacterium]